MKKVACQHMTIGGYFKCWLRVGIWWKWVKYKSFVCQ